MMVQVRYICTGISENKVAGLDSPVHSIELTPDTTDETFVHGTVIRIGWYGGVPPFAVNSPVTLTLEG